MYRTRSDVGPLPLWAIVAALLVAFLALAASPASAQAEDAFPEADPENQGLSSEALQALADVVGDYIDRDMAVGAELLVIKNGHTVLHEALGSRDREAGSHGAEHALQHPLDDEAHHGSGRTAPGR